MQTKNIIVYLIYALLATNGAYIVITESEFSFFWWLGFINVAAFGGILAAKFLECLDLIK